MADISELAKEINKMGKIKAKKINPNSKKFKKTIERVIEAKKECLGRKNIDWDKMNRTYITI